MKTPTDVRKKDPIKNLHKATEEKINNINKKVKKITIEIEKLQTENQELIHRKDELVVNVQARGRIRRMMLKKKGIDADKGGQTDTNVQQAR